MLTLRGWVADALRLALSRDAERQQLKRFAYACALLISGLLGIGLLKVWTAGVLISFLGFGLFPVVTGIAKLRHHLYDIDVIINRTLVYGVLTGTLALVYFGSVMATHAFPAT
jgi:hypothetical protein